jgi:hypothetical protein
VTRYTYDEDRERPIGPDTELRVHGVGGTSPESLLYEHHPIMVGGDEIAGFFRPRDRDQMTEAYAWGGLTARSSVRALWIALLPFAFVNVAGWMVPQGRAGKEERYPFIEALVRMIGVGSTVSLTALIATISVDIFALQCGGQDSCAGQSVWLRWMRSSFFTTSPNRLIVVGLLPPLVTLIVLWYLGRSTSEQYEARFPLSAAGSDDQPRTGLARSTLWHEAGRVRSLGLVHVGAAVALLAAATSWTLFRAERYAEGMIGEWEAPLQAWLSGGRLILWLSLLILVAAVLVAGWGENLVMRTGQWLASFSIVLLLVAMIDGLRPRPTFAGDVMAMGSWFSGFMWAVVFPVLLLLIAILFVRLWDVRRRQKKEVRGQNAHHESRRVAMAGLGPVVVVSIGLIAMTSVLAGLALAAAEFLGSRKTVSEEPYIRIFTDWDVVALGFLVFLTTIGLWLLGSWLLLRNPRAMKERLAAIESEWFDSVGINPPPPRDAGQAAWLGHVDRLRQIRAKWIPSLDTPLWLGVAVAIVMALGYLADREVLGVFHRYVFVERHPWTETLRAGAGWLVVLLPVAAWGLLWRSFRDQEVRRTVGTLWDVLTFWPRWFHPFAPPPYTARAIPELATRVQDRLISRGETDDHGDSRVVLSAHSQGSVIAVAAILQLGARAPADEDTRRGNTLDCVALITHGSPLASLYGRFFPAFFNTGCLQEVQRQLTRDGQVRWRNLYRLTDPIGQRLFADDLVDREVVDPPAQMPKAGDPLPQPRGHSEYYLDPIYSRTVDELFDLLRGGPGPGPRSTADTR